MDEQDRFLAALAGTWFLVGLLVLGAIAAMPDTLIITGGL